jgi:four helix bundle protein
MEVTMASSYKDLRIWRESIDLAIKIYQITQSFPRHETYGITSQLRRAAVSISSNIAEGKGRSSDKEFIRFLHTARGSILELQTQLVISRELGYLDSAVATQLLTDTDHLGKGVNALINSLKVRAVA